MSSLTNLHFTVFSFDVCVSLRMIKKKGTIQGCVIMVEGVGKFFWALDNG